MITQITPASSTCAHSLIRKPVTRLAIPTEASTHMTTPSAIRFSWPRSPNTGVSTLATSSGPISDVGYARW